MRKLCNQLIALTVVLLIVACDSASTDSVSSDTTEKKDGAQFDLEAAKSAVSAENAKFIEDFRKGDSTAIASHYSSDGLLFPPNSEPVTAPAIASIWAGFIRMAGPKDLKLLTDDVTGNEELLVETGRYEFYGDNSKLIDKGNYVVVWKKENGNWQMYRDIGVTSIPTSASK